MDFVEIILLIGCFAPVVAVALIARTSCIKPLKPIETPNLRIDKMMEGAETEHYPMNDVEFEKAKKAIRFANQKTSILAGCMLIWVIVTYYICVWGFDEDMGKIYIVAACIAYGLFLVNRIKSIMILRRIGSCFLRRRLMFLMRP